MISSLYLKQSAAVTFVLLQIIIGVAYCAYGAGAPEQLRRGAGPQSGDVNSNKEQFVAPASRTNINQVTDFFNQNIEDKRNIETVIEQSRQGAQTNIATSAASAEIPSSDKADSEVGKLSNISAYELESAGMRARQSEEYEFYDQNGFEIDHTKPLVMQHKKDMDKIADSSEALLGKLTAGLKDLGIDCQTVAGSQQQEPEYYINIEQEQKLDTVYDKKFCEQPHHTYSCNYVLSTTCVRPSLGYKEWQDKTINYYDVHYHWLYSIKWKKKRWGMHMKSDPGTMHQVRQGIASKMKAQSIEQIHPYINISARGEGAIRESGHNEVKWDYYVFGYKYRESYPICLEWKDTWREQCKVD